MKWWHLHGHIEEAGEQELIVDGHRNEATLVEFRGRLPHHDAQTNAPGQKQDLHWEMGESRK